MRTESSRQAGSVTLTMAISITLSVGAFLATIFTLTSSEIWKARADGDRLRAEVLAENGLEAGLEWIRKARAHATLNAPFELLDALSTSQWTGIALDEPVHEGGRPIGTYSTWVQAAPSTWNEPGVRMIQVRAVGAFARGGAGRTTEVSKSLLVRVEFARSEVFEYAYFLDNWGWLYSSQMTVVGNVRSNGPFDFGGHSPTVDAQPRFRRVDALPGGGHDLLEERDAGGIYSGWAIRGASRVQGTAASAPRQHAFEDRIAMPSLADLTPYETRAMQSNGRVTVVAGLPEPLTLGPVVGDEIGEPQHLYLFGTASAPIVLDGPIVCRGHVYVAGVVTGRGALYAGGNIYVGDDLIYLNPPSTLRPATNAEVDLEAWLAQNEARDALGLYARGHVVIGDATTAEFQNAVGPWLADTRNQSAEVAIGIDGIHDTLAGRDGVLGTDDDDVLEDTAWTVESYTQEHQALGLVPQGRLLGDVVRGSVEDVDHDGLPDPAIGLADLLPSAITWSEPWAGNRPAGMTYADVTTNDIERIDAALYTCHALAGRLNASGTIRFYGCVVSRNEALVFAAQAVEIVHDLRLLLGSNGPFQAPRAWRPLRSWPVSNFDLNGATSGVAIGS